MIKDITDRDFWILVRMGYNMQRLYDANYGEDENDNRIIYLDYKTYIPRTFGKTKGEKRKSISKENSKPKGECDKNTVDKTEPEEVKDKCKVDEVKDNKNNSKKNQDKKNEKEQKANQTALKEEGKEEKNSDKEARSRKSVKRISKQDKPNTTKVRMFDYTRYKVNLTKWTQPRFLTIRMPDNFDYNNYFKNTGLPIK